jgi:hypothetical protein
VLVRLLKGEFSMLLKDNTCTLDPPGVRADYQRSGKEFGSIPRYKTSLKARHDLDADWILVSGAHTKDKI